VTTIGFTFAIVAGATSASTASAASTVTVSGKVSCRGQAVRSIIFLPDSGWGNVSALNKWKYEMQLGYLKPQGEGARIILTQAGDSNEKCDARVWVPGPNWRNRSTVDLELN
jgi:hypothetical protein